MPALICRARGLTMMLASVLTTSALAIDFVHEVVPILRVHCVKCHGGDAAKGGFSLNTRKLFLEGDAAEPGNVKESHFLELIGTADLDMRMPPKDLPRVPVDQRQVLARWVHAGMPWTSGFTFRENSYVPPLLPRKVNLPHMYPNTHPGKSVTKTKCKV